MLEARRAGGDQAERGQLVEHIATELRIDECGNNLCIGVAPDVGRAERLLDKCHIMIRLEPVEYRRLARLGFEDDDFHLIVSSGSSLWHPWRPLRRRAVPYSKSATLLVNKGAMSMALVSCCTVFAVAIRAATSRND
jgi:hypothetical protein